MDTSVITSDEIKKRLWDGANELRGSMNASQYMDYMLGLMFYKFLSDKTLEQVRMTEHMNLPKKNLSTIIRMFMTSIKSSILILFDNSLDIIFSRNIFINDGYKILMKVDLSWKQ